jgi:PhnB protein
MITINPYLNFNGNCEEAFKLYKKVFGGEYDALQRFKEEPGVNHTAADAEKIMHVALPLGHGFILMGSDRPPAMGPGTMGENLSLSIGTESKKQADEVFNGLAEGGKITMPIADTFWGSYFGMVNDRFGVQWMVSFSEQR